MKTAVRKTKSPLAAAAAKAKARNATKSAKPSKTPATPAKIRRLEEIAESKKGLFSIDPTLISVEDGFNERLNYGDIQTLAEDIANNGLEQPLKIRKLTGSETIYIVHGHRRHKAITTILIPQGRWHHPDGSVKPVDCYSEEKGTTEFERLAGQLSSNTGLPYNLLEKAGVYKRLLAIDPSLKPADLARRFGESKQAVSDALRLSNDGSPRLHKAILDGRMAASTAITIIKQAGNDHAAQDEALKAAMESTNGSGYISPKHLGARDSSRPDPNPAPTTPTEESPPFIADPSDDQATTHGFDLYLISDAPTDPIDPETPSTYHETDRFVLCRPEQYGLTRLHLLSVSPSENVTAYGFRINDHEQLPDVTHAASLEDDVTSAFHSILNSAFAKAPELTGEFKDEIRDALDDAIFTYLDANGPAEEPKQLSFVATAQTEPADLTGSNNPGFRKTLNSSGGGSGGGGNGGGSTYLDPQTFKAVQKIEDVLENLAENGKGIPDRVTTADIIVGILRDGRPVSDLKNYLLGK